MATVTATAQVAFAYKSSKRGDALLHRAAELAASLDRELAVVVPFVIPADGPGCCGLRGQAWRDVLRQDAEDDAQRARRLLAAIDVPRSITVREGAAVPEIVTAFVAEGERDLALPKTSAGTAFSRADLRRIRRRGPALAVD